MGIHLNIKNQSSNLKHWELVNFCEIDKFAIKSYCVIHDVDKDLNLGDITNVDETKLTPFNMICGGSPCQDFSIAGEQKGSVWTCKDCGYEYNPLTVYWSKRDKCPNCFSDNIEKTRSSLLVEYLRIIKANKPNFGIYENVKNIVGKRFRKTTFKLFEEELHEYGYNTYWKVLNAKDYGVPQNRERVYLIFIKKELDNGKFQFPKGFDNGIRLKDVLEREVDEKYYISEDKVQKLITNLNSDTSVLYDPRQMKMEGKSREYNDYCPTLTSRDYKEPKLINTNAVKQVGNIVDTVNWENPQRGRIYSPDGCFPALTCVSGGGLAPKIVCGIEKPKARGFNKGGNTTSADFVKDKIRIRKLTPKEYFRLMGFSDESYYAAKVGSITIAKKILDKYPHQGKRQMEEAERLSRMSATQLYKQAGNSIVVDVLYYIFVELYKAMPYLFDDLKLSSFFSGIGAFEIALNRLYESINTENLIDTQAE